MFRPLVSPTSATGRNPGELGPGILKVDLNRSHGARASLFIRPEIPPFLAAFPTQRVLLSPPCSFHFRQRALQARKRVNVIFDVNIGNWVTDLVTSIKTLFDLRDELF